ncbi:MAG: 5'-3' exonuclease H3TH domain-containing protein [Acidobacteriota bacterium]
MRGARVVCVDRRSGRVLDDGGVREKFGVAPASIPDWLALVGDDADGIPGIPGWGAVSASTVLARYGHFEDVPPLHAQWDVKVRGALRLAGNLRERYQDALLYRTLATLRTDAPIPCRLEDVAWDGIPMDRFEPFCREHGFADLVERAGAERTTTSPDA